MNTQRMRLVGLVLAMGLSGATHAALVSRLDGQAVYDTDLNVTWMANANLAATNTFGVSGINTNGSMTWDTAQSWIGAMNTGNYLGYNDWMLPTTLQPDASCGVQQYGISYGINCTGSQLGHLFYSELGGVGTNTSLGIPITTTHNASYSLFNNVQADYYWSGTEYAGLTTYAWFFDFTHGKQNNAGKSDHYFALAVRPGDVALTCTDPTCTATTTPPDIVTSPPSVPEPESWGLMLSGLSLVGWAARQRKERI